MIECVTGMPGSGKSFFLTNVAFKEMKKGRNVFSNFYIKGANKITFDDLCHYSFPSDSVVLVDEAGRWFNSRSWEKLPSDVFDLFTMHRHMKLDLYVGVQNFNRIDKSLREVIELTWWARNYYLLPFFIYDGYYDLEKIGVMKEEDKRAFVMKSRKVKKLYDTYTMKSEWDDKVQIPFVEWEEGFVYKGKLGRMKDKLFKKKKKQEFNIWDD